MSSSPIRVTVTGGAGQIGYSLLFRIAAGELFGPNQKVSLSVLELPIAMKGLEGVAMEIEDCAFPLLDELNLHDSVDAAMKDTNWALLVGSKPRGKGMERSDLIKENGPIFTSTGKAINDHAAANVRILTVGNPCNTNCLIAMHNAPDVPRERFTAMTRLDQNRAVAQLATKAGCKVTDVSRMAIWGNHSASQVPDYANARIKGQPVTAAIGDLAWLQSDFISTVGKRGAAIIEARGKSSAASAASAAIDTVKSLVNPTPKDDVFSLAIPSDGNPYGIPSGLIFSFPCRSKGDGSYEIVDGFKVDDFLKGKIKETTDELLEERAVITDLLG